MYICVTKANNMTFTEIRNEINKRTEVGFTTNEAFEFLRISIKQQGQKVRNIDKIAEAQQKNGTYQYGFTGKEYGNRKWGKQ
jgi:hypothetical protein